MLRRTLLLLLHYSANTVVIYKIKCDEFSYCKKIFGKGLVLAVPFCVVIYVFIKLQGIIEELVNPVAVKPGMERIAGELTQAGNTIADAMKKTVAHDILVSLYFVDRDHKLLLLILFLLCFHQLSFVKQHSIR